VIPVPRKPTRLVSAGRVPIGGASPIAVQSMVKLPMTDARAVLAQIEELAQQGCELCRLAVPDHAALEVFGWVAKRSPLPLVADVHFDYRLALGALRAGAAKLRVNPGNLGGDGPLREVARAVATEGVPIRVGVNMGSLEPDIAAVYGYSGEAMALSAMRQVERLEELGVDAIVISAKAHGVPVTVDAYRRLARSTPWPLHLGVTEAGPGTPGLVKSAVGIGLLLAEGIGDTIRVSLSAPARTEVEAAYAILASLELRRRGPELVSCPTCGRCQFDLLSLVGEVEQRLSSIREPLVVAVMGCAVNGPGEARRADVGIAGAGPDRAVLFAQGKVVRSIPAAAAADELMAEVARIRAGLSGTGDCGPERDDERPEGHHEQQQ